MDVVDDRFNDKEFAVFKMFTCDILAAVNMNGRPVVEYNRFRRRGAVLPTIAAIFVVGLAETTAASAMGFFRNAVRTVVAVIILEEACEEKGFIMTTMRWTKLTSIVLDWLGLKNCLLGYVLTSVG